jgi:hypothetical protein
MVATARLRLLGQPGDARLDEPSPNPRHRLGRQIEVGRDVDPARARRTQQDDARPARDIDAMSTAVH